ncbi:haloacid dehalogenase type II [Paracoccus pacificus]|uniref:Haloacid dehalogenase type II n=1 Tax=Paracoccus pacificus TaxID=1463598 RepID=A0ABW4RAK2_9RHOB
MVDISPLPVKLGGGNAGVTRGVKMQAAVFDVFGTVVDWRGGIMRAVADFADRHGIDGIDAGAFADAWRRRYSPAMEQVRSGKRGFVRLDVLHYENLIETLAEFGLNPADFDAATLQDLNHAWHRLDPWPDSVAGLTAMKSQMIIAPLSNGNVSLLLNMAKRAGLPWDAILGAEIARAYKPQPEAYLRTAEILDLPPADIVMVAAHNSDLAAARACGFRTAFLPRPTEHGPGQTTDLRAESDWDFVAADLVDLAGRLAAGR